MSPDRLLRIPEVAERLGYERSHTYALIRQGKLPVPVIEQFGQMRVSERALERWMEQAGRPITAAKPKAVEKPTIRTRRRQVAVPVPEESVVWPVAHW